MKRLAVLLAFVVVATLAAVIPPGQTTEAQTGCFTETGFCVQNAQFADYFRLRGGVRILGYPISREFTLDGFRVQFFQRVVLQIQNGQVARLNVLDPQVMPMTRANQSIFPGPDPALAAQAPQPSSPTYAQDVVTFVKQVAPDTYNGINVGFFNLFNTTVPVEVAFPGQTPNPDIVTLLNLEIWGLPTSHPAPDPGNGGFIYQRFQRGIMHYDSSCGCTQGILVGEYLKAVMTGRSLPADLDQDMQNSRFYKQYDPTKPNWIARPTGLPSSDLTGAFEPGTGPVTGAPPPPPPAATVPGATATATSATAGTTITVQLDDDTVDPGQAVTITVIANHTVGIDWIQVEGVYEGNDNNQNDNDAAADSSLARQEFDCDDNVQCAKVVTITPTVPGRYTIRARLRDVNDLRTDWIGSASLRVRGETGTTPTTTATTTPAATSTQAPTATTVPPTQPAASPAAIVR
jgi:hypothetical protein